MALLLMAPRRNMKPWKDVLLEEDPNLDIRIWPAVGDAESIQFAVTWNHPGGELQKFPNLKAVSSLGAGVDHLIKDPMLPAQVDICRVVSPSLSRQMCEYVTTAVLTRHRKFLEYFAQKQRGEWKPLENVSADEQVIGVMGLGKLGLPVAEELAGFGFQVRGWSKTPKAHDQIETYAGQDEFEPFLNELDILICLLPLTPETEGILDLDVFRSLNHPAYVVNTARGEHLVEEDLVYAIDRGWVDGACLDVFETEPLPDSHPFWNRSQIMITPHIASVTPPSETAQQLVDNYKRAISGMPLLNVVDRDRGY